MASINLAKMLKALCFVILIYPLSLDIWYTLQLPFVVWWFLASKVIDGKPEWENSTHLCLLVCYLAMNGPNYKNNTAFESY